MKQLVHAVVRTNFRFFLMKVYGELHPGAPPLELGWYLKALCHSLSEASKNPGTRLVINVPPRHTKSIAVSVAFTAWLLGFDPTVKIMVATYSEDLARLHSRHTRQIMETEWYRALFPQTRLAIKGTRLLELTTTRGGCRKAVTVGGSVTGHGADVIIMDDCLKADEARSEARREEVKQWYDGSLATRMNDMGGGMIISISQRLHEDDPPAYLLDKGFDHLNLPAIAEKDEFIPIALAEYHHRRVGELLGRKGHTREKLDAERKKIGAYTFSCQFQQNPVAPEGNLVKMEWFGSFDRVFERHDFTCVAQSWDTASSELPGADFSVCTTWGYRDRHWHLIHVLRERLAYPDLKRAVLRLNHVHKPDVVLIEDAGTGKSLWQEFRARREFLPVMWPVDADKETRLIGVTGLLESGLVRLPTEAPWLDAFRSEFRAFPNGRKDDQVDSTTQFLDYLICRGEALLEPRDERGRRLRISRRSHPRYT